VRLWVVACTLEAVQRPVYRVLPSEWLLQEGPCGRARSEGRWHTDQKWYIYPLCGDHNKHKGELDVSDSYTLVSANKKETCEK
jgi:hypothetical protein